MWRESARDSVASVLPPAGSGVQCLASSQVRRARYVSKRPGTVRVGRSAGLTGHMSKRGRIMGTYSIVLIAVAAVILVVAFIMKKTKA